MSRRKRYDDRLRTAEERYEDRQQLFAFNVNVCLVCAGPARQVTVEQVPELLGHVFGGGVTAEQLVSAVRARGLDGCVTSLAGVSVCRDGRVHR